MRFGKSLILTLCLSAAVAGGCARPPKSTPIFLSAQPSAIVLAAAIIAPETLLNVVVEAVKAAPDSAVAIAAAATAGAPDQAAAIRANVTRLSPMDAEAITAATKPAPRSSVTRIDIPNHDRLMAIVERATR